MSLQTEIQGHTFWNKLYYSVDWSQTIMFSALSPRWRSNCNFYQFSLTDKTWKSVCLHADVPGFDRARITSHWFLSTVRPAALSRALTSAVFNHRSNKIQCYTHSHSTTHQPAIFTEQTQRVQANSGNSFRLWSNIQWHKQLIALEAPTISDFSRPYVFMMKDY